jgi:hypothetical protein
LIVSVKNCATNGKRRLSTLPNVSSYIYICIYIYNVKISGLQELHIQGDSGGICHTLGNDSMCDSKQKSSYKHVSDFGRLRSYDRLKLRIEGAIIDNKRNKIINQLNT